MQKIRCKQKYYFDKHEQAKQKPVFEKIKTHNHCKYTHTHIHTLAQTHKQTNTKLPTIYQFIEIFWDRIRKKFIDLKSFSTLFFFF